MRQQLPKHIIAHTAYHDIRVLMGMSHNLDPGLVNVGESLSFLGKLLGDVTAHEHSLQVYPEVLDSHPVLNDLSGGGQLLDPLLDVSFEGSIVSEHTKIEVKKKRTLGTQLNSRI